MHIRTILSVALIPMLASGCATMEPDVETVGDTQTVAAADLRDAAGAVVGRATLDRDGNALEVNLTVDRMSAGVRAFHLHTTGRCDAPDFTSAGGHLNPFGKSHGQLSGDGKHLGDLPNVVINSDGSAVAAGTLEGSAEDLLPLIFDNDGTAVMLHGGADDYVSDPAGAAGPRIACGVLRRPG